MDLRWLASARVVDLAHPLERGMPVSPNHPAFEIAMMRRHGDVVRPGGGSAANEMITIGGHVGTHIDALGHVSQDGLLHGGVEAEEVQGNRDSVLSVSTPWNPSWAARCCSTSQRSTGWNACRPPTR